MIKTPLLNTKLVQHMDVPMIPDVLMLNAGESLEGALFRRGDLLDALSVDIYFKDVESRLHNVFDVVTTKLRNHISDTYCHTNPDEKRYWNNKLDKNDFDSAFAVLKSRLDGYEGSLDDIRSILNSLPDFDLYALKTDLKDFITGDDLEDILKNIGLIDEDGAPIINVDTITNIINNADLSNYVKKGSILGTINGIEFREGSSITISGGTSPSGDLYLTANDLKTINGQSIVGTGNIVIDGGGSGGGSSSDTFITNVTNVLKDNLKYETAVQKTDSGAYKLGTVMVEVPNNTGYEALFEIWGHDLRGSGGGGGTDPTDISDLEDRLNDFEGRLGNIDQAIEDLQNREEEDLKEDIKTIITEGSWFIENIPWGEVFHEQAWSDALDAYFSEVAYVDPEGNTVTWSQVILSYGLIELSVSELERLIGEDGEISGYITRLSELEQTVNENGNAVASLKTKWALTDENENLLKWFASGFESQAGEHESFALMFAATDDAASLAKTWVTENGEAFATLSTKVNNFLSGVEANATLDQAVASLFATDGNATAAVITTVTQSLSFVNVVADEINLKGFVTADEIAANYITAAVLEGGTATFRGSVYATDFHAGDLTSANMVIDGDTIDFYFGDQRRAYFSQGEDNLGMQLHIMNTDGTWYIIDFTNGTWSSDGGGSTQYAYYAPANRSNLYVMQSTPLYFRNGTYYTNTQLTNKANGTYYTQAEVYNRDGEGEALYGVVSDSNNEIHVAAYVKNLIRYESVEFSNGAIVSSQTKYIYTGRAPKQLVLKADGTPSNINYDNVDTMLVSVESNVDTQWLYNGYTNGIVSDTNTIINPVISGTYAQISNAGFSEYEVLDLGSQFAPQLIFIDEDDELTW